MGDILYIATLIVIALVVLVLVVYLVLVIYHLFKGAGHLKELAVGLQKIAEDTDPLTGKLTTINDALDQLYGGLTSVNGHLGAIAKVLKL